MVVIDKCTFTKIHKKAIIGAVAVVGAQSILTRHKPKI